MDGQQADEEHEEEVEGGEETEEEEEEEVEEEEDTVESLSPLPGTPRILSELLAPSGNSTHSRVPTVESLSEWSNLEDEAT